MIVTQAEIAELERLLTGGREHDGLLAASSYVRRNPHLILPCGFDEVRIDQAHEPWVDPAEDPRLDQMRDGLFKGRSRSEVITLLRRISDSVDLRSRLNCRRIESGVWYESSLRPSKDLWTHRVNPPIYLVPKGDRLRWFYDKTYAQTIALDLRSIALNCRKAVQSPDEFGAIILPNLWIPPEDHPRLELVEATRGILEGLKVGHLSLKDITWRQLEEIVAELLRSRGMDVTITSAGSDGGRDVIARGELIPDEPVVLAVEVKHRDVVSLDEVRSRLYANREFPALLFATSGRFSAGVIREKKRPENFLRMFLKDGVALRHWIDDYRLA